MKFTGEEWKDLFDAAPLHKGGKPRHISGNKNGMISTAFVFDNQNWETMFITPDEKYFCLQTYESAKEAREGHIFWAKKVKEGFVPTTDLVENFTTQSMLNFLKGLIEGAYERTKD